jgi:pyrimidine operon attenuation protein/uracil phosphoribosyltransferase
MIRLTPEEIDGLVADMAARLRVMLHDDRDTALMVGLQTGGYWLAERLHALLQLPTPLGSVNSRFYRDDFSQRGLHAKVGPSNLPLSVEGRCVVLVDDVLYTGRTIRAAMNELFDYGRPAAIRLAVLIDRGGHELPIAADIVGRTLEVPAGQHVKLSGPAPLSLDVIERLL